MKITKTQYFDHVPGEYDKQEISRYSVGSLKIRFKKNSKGIFCFDVLAGDRARWRRLTRAELSLLVEISAPHLGFWVAEMEEKIKTAID